MHGKRTKYVLLDLAEQMNAGIQVQSWFLLKTAATACFLEETPKFNAELIKFAGK